MVLTIKQKLKIKNVLIETARNSASYSPPPSPSHK
jgi:hypothetical protein